MIDSKWLQAEIDKLAAEEKEALEALILAKEDLVQAKTQFAAVQEKLEGARDVRRELEWQLHSMEKQNP
jgi:predicted  nucleic acid-binding Zn-ribbon protein